MSAIVTALPPCHLSQSSQYLKDLTEAIPLNLVLMTTMAVAGAFQFPAYQISRLPDEVPLPCLSQSSQGLKHLAQLIRGDALAL